MTNLPVTTKPSPSSLYTQAEELARKGLGYEDVIAILKIKPNPIVYEWAKAIVFRVQK